MDLQRAKIFLDKINREFLNMTRDPENISTIDVDILRQYVRDFYDAVLTEKHAVVQHVAAAKTNVVEVPAPKVQRPIGFNPERPKAEPKNTPPPPIFDPSPPTQVIDNQPVTPPEAVYQPAPPPVYEAPKPAPPPPQKPEPQPAPEPIYQPTIEKIQAPKAAAPAPAPAVSASADDATLALFEFKAAKELSERLSELPIADLKKSLSLNDRLLMTRELFGGDGPELEKTLVTVNALGSFDEAKSYLVAFCAVRFGWAEKARAEHARAFIKLIRRRFK